MPLFLALATLQLRFFFLFFCSSPVVILHCSENVCAFFFLFILYLVSRVDHPSCLQTPALIPPVTSLISSFERDTKTPASFGSAGPEDLTLPPLLTLQFLPASMLPSVSLSFPLSSWLCSSSRGCSCRVVIKIFSPLCFSLCFFFKFYFQVFSAAAEV